MKARERFNSAYSIQQAYTLHTLRIYRWRACPLFLLLLIVVAAAAVVVGKQSCDEQPATNTRKASMTLER